MDKRYVVTTIKTLDTDFSVERYFTERIALHRTIVDSLSPKKSIIDILLDVLAQFKKIRLVTIFNRETWYRREFSDMHTFVSWTKKLTIEKLCEIEFKFAVDGISDDDKIKDVVFSVKECLHSDKIVKPKLLNLEIKEFFEGETILEEGFSNFEELDDFVQSLIDPSHKKFLPNNPCINIDCRFVVNDCDITDYFLQVNDLNINCYEVDGTQVLEYTRYNRLGATTIQHVLAIEKQTIGYEDVYTPHLVYSSVIDNFKMKKRYRGISQGKSWDKEIKTLMPESSLFYKIQAYSKCCDEEGKFKKLLDQYSDKHPVTSFICIQLLYFNDTYVIEIRQHYIGPNNYVHALPTAEDYSYLIPPHEKWTYEDFDVIL